MRFRRLAPLAVGLGVLALPHAAGAQATGDQATLTFGVSLGVVGGKDLWSVRAQPVQFTDQADTLTLSRTIPSNFAVAFSGSYFPGATLGLAVEGFLIGLGFEDSCRLAFSSGSGAVASACESIQGATKSASAVYLSAGPVGRINSRKPLSPYARAQVGLVFSNQSSLRTIGEFPTGGGLAALIVYDDDHDSRVAPAFVLGAGVTAAIAKGYQLRWEVRDNIMGVQKVTRPSLQSGVVPPHELEFKHLFSMTVGFDVLLERRRGRRY
jgi:hypothetical protein